MLFILFVLFQAKTEKREISFHRIYHYHKFKSRIFSLSYNFLLMKSQKTDQEIQVIVDGLFAKYDGNFEGKG